MSQSDPGARPGRKVAKLDLHIFEEKTPGLRARLPRSSLSKYAYRAAGPEAHSEGSA